MHGPIAFESVKHYVKLPVNPIVAEIAREEMKFKIDVLSATDKVVSKRICIDY